MIINHPISCHPIQPLLSLPFILMPLINDRFLSYRRDIPSEKMEVEEEEFFHHLFKVIESTLNGAQRIYSYMNLEPLFSYSGIWPQALGQVF